MNGVDFFVCLFFKDGKHSERDIQIIKDASSPTPGNLDRLPCRLRNWFTVCSNHQLFCFCLHTNASS